MTQLKIKTHYSNQNFHKLKKKTLS